MEIKQLKLNGENIYPKVAIDSIVGEDGSSKVDTVVTENSDNLITSGAVYEAVQSGTGHSVAWENITGKPEFANVATSGDYNDLIDKPYLSTVATSGNYNDLNNKPDLSIYAQSVNLASVATTGNYNDLTNKPSIPAAQVQSDWTQSDTTAVDYIKHKPFNDIRNFVTDDGNHPSLKGDATDYISFTGANGISTSHPAEDYIVIDGSELQPTLVSGTNIKTINGNSLLGAGNIEIQGGGTITVDDHLDANSTNPVQNKVINGVVSGLSQDVSGKVSSVKVGNTTYNPTSGVVSLPAYPIGDVTKVSYSNYAGDFTPDQNGVVTLTIDQSLDEDSGRPVTNAAVSIKFNSVDTAISNVTSTVTNMTTTLVNHSNAITAIERVLWKDDENQIDKVNGRVDSLSSVVDSALTDIDDCVETIEISNNKLKYTTSGGVTPVEVATIDTTPASNSRNLITSGGVYSALDGKQARLVSGTNIKTINNQSILGSGNITISGSGSTGRQVISFISSDGEIDQAPVYALAIPFTDDAFTIRVTAVDCTSSGDRFSTKTNVYTVFAKRYSNYAMRVVNRDGDNNDMIKTANSLANTTVTYEGLSSSSSDLWFLPIQVTSSYGLKAVIMEIIGATINGSQASVSCYPGGLTYPNSLWRNNELNNLSA